MLQLKNIHKTFNLGTINEKVALNGVNLKLNEGDFVTVIGGNGAGKSTLLDAIQFVVTCSTNYFNKAAHENGKRKYGLLSAVYHSKKDFPEIHQRKNKSFPSLSGGQKDIPRIPLS